MVDSEGHHVGSIVLQPDESGQSPDLSGKLITSTITDPQDGEELEVEVGGSLPSSPEKTKDSDKGWDVLGKATTAYQLWNVYQMPITHGLTFAAKMYQGGSPKASKASEPSPESANQGTIRNVLGKATSAYNIVDGYKVPAQQALGFVERYRQPKDAKEEEQPSQDTQGSLVQAKLDSKASVTQNEPSEESGGQATATSGPQTATRVEGLDDPFTEKPTESADKAESGARKVSESANPETPRSEHVDDTAHQPEAESFGGHADPTNAEFRIEDEELVMDDDESKAGSTFGTQQSPKSPRGNPLLESGKAEEQDTSDPSRDLAEVSKDKSEDNAGDSKSKTDRPEDSGTDHTEQKGSVDVPRQAGSELKDNDESTSEKEAEHNNIMETDNKSSPADTEERPRHVEDDVQGKVGGFEAAAIDDQEEAAQPSTEQAAAEMEDPNLQDQEQKDNKHEEAIEKGDKQATDPVKAIGPDDNVPDKADIGHGDGKASAESEKSYNVEKPLISAQISAPEEVTGSKEAPKEDLASQLGTKPGENDDVEKTGHETVGDEKLEGNLPEMKDHDNEKLSAKESDTEGNVPKLKGTDNNKSSAKEFDNAIGKLQELKGTDKKKPSAKESNANENLPELKDTDNEKLSATQSDAAERRKLESEDHIPTDDSQQEVEKTMEKDEGQIDVSGLTEEQPDTKENEPTEATEATAEIAPIEPVADAPTDPGDVQQPESDEHNNRDKELSGAEDSVQTKSEIEEADLAEAAPTKSKSDIDDTEGHTTKELGGDAAGENKPPGIDQVAVDTKSGWKRKEDPKPDAEKLAKEISAAVDQSMKELDPILNEITRKVNAAEKAPKNKRDEKKLVDEVQPLIERGNKILKATNSKIRSMDPDGRIQRNAKLTTQAGVATEAENFLANQLSTVSSPFVDVKITLVF